MVVPRLELDQIVRGEVGETVVSCAPAVGAEVWVRRSPLAAPKCRARVVDVWPVQGGFSVLLERVGDAFDLPPRVPSERPRLRLTRTQRSQLFAGGFPHIGGDGMPPVEAGAEVRLSARVTLRVVRVDVKRGRWRLVYEVVDTRDRVLLLRRTPPAHREGDELDIHQEGAIREAAVQSFYTSTPSAAVTDAGEAPDRGWVEVRTRTVREFDHQRRLAKHAEEMRQKSKAKRERKAA